MQTVVDGTGAGVVLVVESDVLAVGLFEVAAEPCVLAAELWVVGVELWVVEAELRADDPGADVAGFRVDVLAATAGG